MGPARDGHDRERAEQKREPEPATAIAEEVGRALAIESARRKAAGKKEEEPHEKGRINAKEHGRPRDRRVRQRDFRGVRLHIGLDQMVSDHEHDQGDAEGVDIRDAVREGPGAVAEAGAAGTVSCRSAAVITVSTSKRRTPFALTSLYAFFMGSEVTIVSQETCDVVPLTSLPRKTAGFFLENLTRPRSARAYFSPLGLLAFFVSILNHLQISLPSCLLSEKPRSGRRRRKM